MPGLIGVIEHAAIAIHARHKKLKEELQNILYMCALCALCALCVHHLWNVVTAHRLRGTSVLIIGHKQS